MSSKLGALPRWGWYVAAVVLAVAAIATRLLLPGFFGEGNWFIQSHPAVLLAAWLGGIGPGLVATAVTSTASAYFFVPPVGGLPTAPDDVRLTLTAVGIGVFISLLTGALRDSQVRLHYAGAEAQAAHERYRHLLDMTPVPVFVNHEDRMVYANEAMGRLVGRDPADLMGTSPLSLVHPESHAVVAARIQSMRAGDTSKVPWVAQKWTRSDGTTVLVEAAARVVPWERTSAIQVILRDVTAEHAAAAERERLLLEAQHANQAKDDFLATLSHELRTPINVVLGWLHMLRGPALPEDQRRHAMDVIYRNTVAQARLVEDVLDLSRVVTGRLTLHAEEVDLTALVHATAEALAATFMSKRQHLRIETQPGCTVHGDPQRLRQVLWNILSNASKFTPEEGVITVQVRNAAGLVHVAVTDTGQGVDPGFLPHMFEPFRQEDNSATRAHGGLGLGLALVRRLVEAHGGHVRASSAGVGRGTSIHVELPATRPAGERHAGRVPDTTNALTS